ncbi:hypothetical protein [Neobacillus drentensis]|uniref:hypothetical protein n=1 Tax=Neobacillus drentensis TaxID=220684 RepID=UPI003003128B
MGNYISFHTTDNSPLLQKDQMYQFSVTATNNGYFEMIPKYGYIILDNEGEKLKQIDALRKEIMKN